MTKFVEQIKIHILCSGTCSANRVLYWIMWENMADRGNMAHALCMPDQ